MNCKTVSNRKSNFELLRLISMILVLILHSTKAHNKIECGSHVHGIINETISIASYICVNIFVLISGWFGIRLKKEGIVKLLFQAVFLSLLTYLILLFCRRAEFSYVRFWHASFGVLSMLWFVWAYLLLYIFAPVLNSFVDNCSQKQIKTFLLCYYAFAMYVYFTLKIDPVFLEGFHTIAFIGLYVLARYIHLYAPKWSSFSKVVDFSIYFVTVILASICVALLKKYHMTEYIPTKFGNYISPFSIISSVYFFLIFSKIQLSSSIINKIAYSSFAVYIVHMQFDAKNLFDNMSIAIFSSHSFVLSWGLQICLVIVAFIVGIVMDMLRIFCYNFLKNYFHEKNINSNTML